MDEEGEEAVLWLDAEPVDAVVLDAVVLDELVDEPLVVFADDETVSAEITVPVETNNNTAAVAPHLRMVWVRRRLAPRRSAARLFGSVGRRGRVG